MVWFGLVLLRERGGGGVWFSFIWGGGREVGGRANLFGLGIRHVIRSYLAFRIQMEEN